MSEVQVTRNEDASRYEAHLDGELAGYAEYRYDNEYRYDDERREGGVVEFPHTVTEPRFGGRGVASAIARTSLEDARVDGLTVRPTCSFYAGWIEKHPEFADLVAD
ncbi:MAG: GNAT family N-acetyltransferase [Mobilicoccus sp.]|nr:GNAT family N-acetyltransferase [Mobilicoccus sp.]